MNTALLQYAVEVEKTGSITRAAANLDMDQPNLSKAIKALEESVGAPIFTRSRKGVAPTVRGRVFLDYARNVLAQIEQMEALYHPESSSGMSLSLSAPRASYISFTFAEFLAGLGQPEDMNIWLRETNTMETFRDVESGEYRLGIIRYAGSFEKYYVQMASEKGLEIRPLWEYRRLALMSVLHRLAQKEEILYEELRQSVEITHGDTAFPPVSAGGLKKTACAQRSQKRIYVFERGSQFDLLCSNPNTYMWVSPLPEEALKRYGLAQRVCRDSERRYKDAVIFSSGCRFNHWEEAFLKGLEAQVEIFKKIEYR